MSEDNRKPTAAVESTGLVAAINAVISLMEGNESGYLKNAARAAEGHRYALAEADRIRASMCESHRHLLSYILREHETTVATAKLTHGTNNESESND